MAEAAATVKKDYCSPEATRQFFPENGKKEEVEVKKVHYNAAEVSITDENGVLLGSSGQPIQVDGFYKFYFGAEGEEGVHWSDAYAEPRAAKTHHIGKVLNPAFWLYVSRSYPSSPEGGVPDGYWSAPIEIQFKGYNEDKKKYYHFSHVFRIELFENSGRLPDPITTMEEARIVDEWDHYLGGNGGGTVPPHPGGGGGGSAMPVLRGRITGGRRKTKRRRRRRKTKKHRRTKRKRRRRRKKRRKTKKRHRRR